MSRKINKEIISDVSDNTAFRSTASKNPDLSQNTLISREMTKELRKCCIQFDANGDGRLD